MLCLGRSVSAEAIDLVYRASEGVDVIFHLAAIASIDFFVKNPLLVNEVNVGGTLNVLKGSLKAGVKRFVHASSCAVYGEPITLPVNEGHSTKSTSPMVSRNLLLSTIAGFFPRSMGLRVFLYGFLMSMGPGK